jgi:hypothetical protein
MSLQGEMVTSASMNATIMARRSDCADQRCHCDSNHPIVYGGLSTNGSVIRDLAAYCFCDVIGNCYIGVLAGNAATPVRTSAGQNAATAATPV